jgi:hypothetical protein
VRGDGRRFVCDSPLWAGAPLDVLSFVSGVVTDPTDPNNHLYNRAITAVCMGSLSLFPRPGACRLPSPSETHLVSLGERPAAPIAWFGFFSSPTPCGNLTGNQSTMYGPDDILIATPSKNYTAFDLDTLLVDLGFGDYVEPLRVILVGLCGLGWRRRRASCSAAPSGGRCGCTRRTTPSALCRTLACERLLPTATRRRPQVRSQGQLGSIRAHGTGTHPASLPPTLGSLLSVCRRL